MQIQMECHFFSPGKWVRVLKTLLILGRVWEDALPHASRRHCRAFVLLQSELCALTPLKNSSLLMCGFCAQLVSQAKRAYGQLRGGQRWRQKPVCFYLSHIILAQAQQLGMCQVLCGHGGPCTGMGTQHVTVSRKGSTTRTYIILLKRGLDVSSGVQTPHSTPDSQSLTLQVAGGGPRDQIPAAHAVDVASTWPSPALQAPGQRRSTGR